MQPEYSSSRVSVMATEAEASPEEAERIREEVKQFIQLRTPEVLIYFITLRKDGRPHGRPVAAFVEGWNVGTISQGEHLKNQHVRNNPEVAYLWVELQPRPGQRVRSVWMQGNCEIVEHNEEIKAFFERREKATGRGDQHPEEEWKRLLLKTTPKLVRAEGFLGPLKPALYRTFE